MLHLTIFCKYDLIRQGGRMDVRSLLKSKGKEVVSLDCMKTVEDAIKQMYKHKISAVIVTSRDKTAGIFTERDVVRCYNASKGKRFSSIKLKEAMTTNVIVAEEKDDLSDIMAIMVEKNIRHLPVVEKGEIVGILSIRDIIQTQVKKLTGEIHYLKDYITCL
jgi:CBS domain-containing protein